MEMITENDFYLMTLLRHFLSLFFMKLYSCNTEKDMLFNKNTSYTNNLFLSSLLR